MVKVLGESSFLCKDQAVRLGTCCNVPVPIKDG
jgi:hypothetical protein